MVYLLPLSPAFTDTIRYAIDRPTAVRRGGAGDSPRARLAQTRRRALIQCAATANTLSLRRVNRLAAEPAVVSITNHRPLESCGVNPRSQPPETRNTIWHPCEVWTRSRHMTRRTQPTLIECDSARQCHISSAYPQSSDIVCEMAPHREPHVPGRSELQRRLQPACAEAHPPPTAPDTRYMQGTPAS